MKNIILRQNKSCKYFPCHPNLEDCTFCYCPFYPCKDKELGKYVYFSRTPSPEPRTPNRIWSCEDCAWIHKKSTVDRIHKSIRNIMFPKPNPESRTPNPENDIAVIILGHGSKVKKANETVNEVIKQIKKRSGILTIEPAYLQMHQPGLHASVQKIVQKGYKKIIIMPFFLFTGNHVSRDVPEAIEKEKQIYKNIRFIYAQNLGSDPRIGDIVLDRIMEAHLRGGQACPPRRCNG